MSMILRVSSVEMLHKTQNFALTVTYRMFLVAFYKYVFVAFSKTYGKSSFFFPSFFSFRTLHQYLWSKLAKSCFSKHFYRSLESSREQALRYAMSRLLVTHSKCIDDMSSVTSRCLEQFQRSTCDIRFPRHSLK